MSEFMSLSLALISLGLLAWREHQHDLERRDLLDRFMARDLGDYKHLNNKDSAPKGRNFVRSGLEKAKRNAGGGDDG